MTYELAKKLKDAGFPFVPSNRYDANAVIMDDGEHWKIPTLSELIEACGDWTRCHFSLYGRDENRWEASRVVLQVFGANQVAPITEYGSTPEEAVANLWLALKKRKNGND